MSVTSTPPRLQLPGACWYSSAIANSPSQESIARLVLVVTTTALQQITDDTPVSWLRYPRLTNATYFAYNTRNITSGRPDARQAKAIPDKAISSVGIRPDGIPKRSLRTTLRRAIIAFLLTHPLQNFASHLLFSTTDGTLLESSTAG